MSSQFTPLHLSVELTNRCNFACVHCLRTNNVAENVDLPLAVYEKFLQDALPYHSPHITFTGGEPTLHADFESILALTARYNYSYVLVTNGWTFEKIYPLLLQYREHLEAIIFSLDGAVEDTHDAIRQQAGSYRKIIQACMLCYYKHLPFRISMTVHRRNVAEIHHLISLAPKLGAEAVNVGTAQITKQLVSKELALSPQERKILQKGLFELQEQAPLPLHLMFDFFVENPFFLCHTLLMTSIAVDYAGCVRFCCQLSGHHTNAESSTDVIGDLRELSLWECHRRLVKAIARFHQEKLRRIEHNTLSEHDYFPCYYCAKYFHTLDWLADFPDSEWRL